MVSNLLIVFVLVTARIRRMTGDYVFTRVCLSTRGGLPPSFLRGDYPILPVGVPPSFLMGLGTPILPWGTPIGTPVRTGWGNPLVPHQSWVGVPLRTGWGTPHQGWMG